MTVDAAGKDGSEAKPYGVEAAVDVAAGDLASFTLRGGSGYQTVPDFTKLHPDNQDLFAFEIKGGKLVLVKKAGSLAAEGPIAVSVAIRGDGIVDRVVHFSLRLLPLREVGTSDGRAEDAAVTLDIGGGKDGSTAAKAYGVKVEVDVAVGDLASFALSGGRGSYNIVKSDLTALDAANQPYFQFAVDKDGRLVLQRTAGDLSDDQPRVISVVIGGDGVEDTTFHFSLEIGELPPVVASGGQAENAAVMLVTASKDGTAASPYGVKIPVNIPANDLVSVALSGGSNYRVVSSQLDALDDANEPYFQFAINKDGRLVLRRTAGDLTVAAAQTISVTIGGDGVEDTTFHFNLEIGEPPPVVASDGQAENAAVMLVTASKDGTAASPYGVKMPVNIPADDLVSFALSGGSNYRVVSSQLGALDDANEPYFQFAIDKDGRLVLQRTAGDLSDDQPRVISVAIGGDSVEDTTFYFSLEIEPLPPATIDGADAVIVRPGPESFADGRNADRDGSEAEPYQLEVRVNAPVGRLLEFTLKGSSDAGSYRIVSQDRSALAANQGHFRFELAGDKLYLSRVGAAAPNIDENLRRISVVIGGNELSDTTFYFDLEVGPLLGASIAAAEVVVDSGAGKDGSSAAKAIAVRVPTDVNVGDVLSFALNGDGYSYEVKSPSLDALGANKDFFEFVIDGNGKLVLRRTAGDLSAAAAQTILVTISGTGSSPSDYSSGEVAVAPRTIHFSVEIYEPPKVTFVTDTDGSYKTPTLPAGMAAGPKADTTIQAEFTAGQYLLTTDLDNLNNYANELAPYGDVTTDGNLPDILEFSLADITALIPSADLEVTVKSGAGFLAVEIRKEGGKLIVRMDESASEALRTISASRSKIGFTLTDATNGETLEVIVTYEQVVELGYQFLDPPAGVYTVDVTDPRIFRYNEKSLHVYYDPAAPLDGSTTPLPVALIRVTKSAGATSLTLLQTDGHIFGLEHADGDDYFIVLNARAEPKAEPEAGTLAFIDDKGVVVHIVVSISRIPYYSVPDGDQPYAAEVKFVETPPRPDIPANERTWRLASPQSSIAASQEPIIYLDLGSPDFKENEAADPDGYLEIRREPSGDSSADGVNKYRYKVILTKTLRLQRQANYDQKTLNLVDDETGVEMKIKVEYRQISPWLRPVIRADIAVVAAGATRDVVPFDMLSPDFVEDTAAAADPDDYLGIKRDPSQDTAATTAPAQYGYIIFLKKTLTSGDGQKVLVLRDAKTAERLRILVEAGQISGQLQNLGLGVTSVGTGDGSQANPYQVRMLVDGKGDSSVLEIAMGGMRDYRAEGDFAALSADNRRGLRLVTVGGGRAVVVERTSAPLMPEASKTISVTVSSRVDATVRKSFYIVLSIVDDTSVVDPPGPTDPTEPPSDWPAISSAVWKPSSGEPPRASESAPAAGDTEIEGLRQPPEEEETSAIREKALRKNDEITDAVRGIAPSSISDAASRRVTEAAGGLAEPTDEGVSLPSSIPAPRQSPPSMVSLDEMSAVAILKPEVVTDGSGTLDIRFRGEQRVVGVVGRLPEGVTFDAALGRFRVDGDAYRGGSAIVTVRVRVGEDDDDERKRRLGVGKAAERLLRIDLAPLIEKGRAIRQEPDGGGKPAKAPDDGDGAIPGSASGRDAGRQDADGIANGAETNGAANGDVVGNVANGVANGHANGIAIGWRGFTAQLERASQDFGGELDALMAQLRKLDED